jgi:hypothetical protein
MAGIARQRRGESADSDVRPPPRSVAEVEAPGRAAASRVKAV